MQERYPLAEAHEIVRAVLAQGDGQATCPAALDTAPWCLAAYRDRGITPLVLLPAVPVQTARAGGLD